MIFPAPCFDALFGLVQRRKPVRVQAVIPQLPVKTLAVSVLSGLPGSIYNVPVPSISNQWRSFFGDELQSVVRSRQVCALIKATDSYYCSITVVPSTRCPCGGSPAVPEYTLKAWTWLDGALPANRLSICPLELPFGIDDQLIPKLRRRQAEDGAV